MKSAYLIRHGVATYFKSLLSDKIKDEYCDFVLLFDESMNSKTQSKQVDFHIRFWYCCQVKTRYYGSQFMGHATSDDMVKVFQEETSVLSLKHGAAVYGWSKCELEIL